jgi:hypothetical protein
VVTRCERDARTVIGFRDQNECTVTASKSFGTTRLTSFVCECSDRGCTQTIELTKPEYESVRSASTRFAVALDHENPESEIVISECARYAVVTTVEPFAIRISRETDRRSLSGGPA